MMATVLELSYEVSHYASHSLLADVQFYTIEKLCSQLKQIHPLFIWFQTTNEKFCRWDIGRYRFIIMVKVMNLLGIVEIMWKVDGEVSGFEYSFIDYVIEGYYG